MPVEPAAAQVAADLIADEPVPKPQATPRRGPASAAAGGGSYQAPHLRAAADELIFGHDLDGSASELPLTAANSAAFDGAAGINSSTIGDQPWALTHD